MLMELAADDGGRDLLLASSRALGIIKERLQEYVMDNDDCVDLEDVIDELCASQLLTVVARIAISNAERQDALGEAGFIPLVVGVLYATYPFKSCAFETAVPCLNNLCGRSAANVTLLRSLVPAVWVAAAIHQTQFKGLLILLRNILGSSELQSLLTSEELQAGWRRTSPQLNSSGFFDRTMDVVALSFQVMRGVDTAHATIAAEVLALLIQRCDDEVFASLPAEKMLSAVDSCYKRHRHPAMCRQRYTVFCLLSEGLFPGRITPWAKEVRPIIQAFEDEIEAETNKPASSRAINKRAPGHERSCAECGLLLGYGAEKGPKGGAKKCAGCKSVFYCSRVCQKKDWKVHKASCILK